MLFRSDADLSTAIKVVKNSKMRNVSICGAAETLLIDKMCLKTHCKPILDQLSRLGCKIIGDKTIKKFISGKMKIATKKDWETEYLSSTISVIGHYEGLCHVYIDRESDLSMAIRIVKNSKMRNVSICGAAETLLIDKMCLKTHCGPILNQLSKLGCKIVGDNIIKKIFPGKMKIAKKKDWETEYLAPIISVKIVNGVNQAIGHINKYGSSHTDTIVTKNIKTAKRFLSNVNSSIAIHNASTQFADGGEFGFGAEVGISTSKLQPRGPIGIDQLTTYKYILEGKGQVRK